MRTFERVVYMIAFVLVLAVTDGLWGLMALVPFLLCLGSMAPEKKGGELISLERAPGVTLVSRHEGSRVVISRIQSGEEVVLMTIDTSGEVEMIDDDGSGPPPGNTSTH